MIEEINTRRLRLRRADEYPSEVATIVCHFQQSREHAPNCNYDALRASLRWARQTYLPITPATLRAAYDIARRPSFHQQSDRDE